MRGTIKTLAGVSALAAAVSCSEKKQAPNILFCIADDASFEHWGAMGCDWVNTPAFDRYPFDDPAKANIYEDVVSGRIPLLGWQGNQRIITRLPASSRTHPAMVFQVRDSPRKMTANMIVSTRLHLSMGTTLLTSPILMA